MSTITEDKIQTILSGIIDENTGKDLVSSENVKNISIDDEIVNVELLLKYPAANFHEDLKESSKKRSLRKASTIRIFLLIQRSLLTKRKALKRFQELRILLQSRQEKVG